MLKLISHSAYRWKSCALWSVLVLLTACAAPKIEYVPVAVECPPLPKIPDDLRIPPEIRDLVPEALRPTALPEKKSP